ncbi:sulfite exporter TauE/SafE family protein [Salinibacter grassmerensis]|uniref:sulfite exporter TauE/SafE family protein n=1 Tax=Salinibacter grassmerensis TaxID=3040353 RepID=UPI0021E82D5A|nr:sulfite exporter TauE/SafE family protein [Salinibacter grassmerensis]
MTILQTVLLGIAGLGAGLVAGLVGVGGGVIFTPVLFVVYGMLGVPAGARTPLTVGTGLFCTGLVAGTSAVHHARRGAVRWRMALGVGLASVGVVGTVSRFVVVQPWYDAATFRVLFAVVLLVVATRMVRGSAGGSSSVDASEEEAPHGWWGHWIGTGTAAGTVAAAVGVGGGVVLVPAYHRWSGHSMHRSVGTSSATIVLISGLSAIAYVVLGLGEAGRPELALGYVDVGTGVLLAGPAVVGAQGGAALAHRFETWGLRWSFALTALVVAGRLVWGAVV